MQFVESNIETVLFNLRLEKTFKSKQRIYSKEILVIPMTIKQIYLLIKKHEKRKHSCKLWGDNFVKYKSENIHTYNF